MKKSELEEKFASLLDERKIKYERQFRICKDRLWKVDFVIGDIFIEIEGGGFSRGGHTSILGFANNITKYNYISAEGYKLFRLTTIHFEKRGAKYLETLLDCIQGLVSIKELAKKENDIQAKTKRAKL